MAIGKRSAKKQTVDLYTLNVYNIERRQMKKRDLIKRLKKAGFQLVRHGGEHDIYGRGNELVSIPRHKEIKENTAKNIIKEYCTDKNEGGML